MLKEKNILFNNLLRISDIMAILISFWLAYYIKFNSLYIFNLANKISYLVFITIFIISWIFLSEFIYLYNSKRLTKLPRELYDIIKIATLCQSIAISVAFFIGDKAISREFLLIYYIILLIIIGWHRLILRSFFNYIRSIGYNSRYVLLVGNNHRTSKIINLIKNRPDFGYKIIGYIDDESSLPQYNQNGLKYLGNLRDFTNIIKKFIIDEVIITLPVKSFYSEINNIINDCEQIGINSKLITDLYSKEISKSCIVSIGDSYFIEFYTTPQYDSIYIFKRAIDIAGSFLILLLISPILLFISLLIKSTSKGPIFFKQNRVGLNGRNFYLFKFRSMIFNAEELKKSLLKLNEQDGPVFKIRNDPRITPVGRILRKYSLDELPQLVNVLKGDMSLVGPRPPTPDEVIKYNLNDRRRLSIKPGITCLWQVNGRNRISFDKWMQMDREYIDNWSAWLDFKILLKTIGVVFKGSGY